MTTNQERKADAIEYLREAIKEIESIQEPAPSKKLNVLDFGIATIEYKTSNLRVHELMETLEAAIKRNNISKIIELLETCK